EPLPRSELKSGARNASPGGDALVAPGPCLLGVVSLVASFLLLPCARPAAVLGALRVRGSRVQIPRAPLAPPSRHYRAGSGRQLQGRTPRSCSEATMPRLLAVRRRSPPLSGPAHITF